MRMFRDAARKTFRTHVAARTVAVLAGLAANGVASAAWTAVDPEPGATDRRNYVDLDTVRQAGPMAIYRQVSELTVFATRLESGVMSILRLSEFDCMDARVRVLKEMGFVSPSASGDTATIPSDHRRQDGWVTLSEHSAGEKVWRLVCPGS